MSHIAERTQAVKSRIAIAAKNAGRDPSGITLLAVSKTFGVDDIVEAEAAGQRAFGENYVQEALGKIDRARENFTRSQELTSDQSAKDEATLHLSTLDAKRTKYAIGNQTRPSAAFAAMFGFVCPSRKRNHSSTA